MKAKKRSLNGWTEKKSERRRGSDISLSPSGDGLLRYIWTGTQAPPLKIKEEEER